MPEVSLKLHERAQVSLKVVSRQEHGKGPVGQLRRLEGQVPGVVYGHKQDPYSFKTSARDFEQILKKGGQNATIRIEHAEGDKESELALVREIQYHKVRGDAMHLDLLRIDPTETLRANVPLITVGVPDGVRNGGGALQQTLTSIEVECMVSEMPAAIEIDISSLQIGDSLHVSDLMQQESRITTDPVRTIVNVLAPRLANLPEDGEEAEGEEAEGEETEGEEETQE
jgi:large subunit ribosomal protein L25